MKNFIYTAVIILSLGILTSCTKKDNIRTSLTVFHNNPFSVRSILATAD
ncbi:hypothetical protein [Mucilaginibacter sp.]|nr:hypothetical protein [Mucilaginibacter sp.]